MHRKIFVLLPLVLAFLFACLFSPFSFAEGAVPQQTIRYDGNGGVSDAFGTTVDRAVAGTHLRENTLQGASYFKRDGYVLTGWNTTKDGSGTHIGLGSRVLFTDGLILYAEWEKATEEDRFAFSNGAILSYAGTDASVVIPESIGGEPVRTIAKGAFADQTLTSLVFPSSLETVEESAFINCEIQTLTLSDKLRTVSDASLSDCAIHTLRINAVRLPAYSGSYYDTFSDKYDYLLSLGDSRKLILFSGSSGRYGYDSPKIESAFPEYRVVNMGVYAYTNALPQYELIRPYLNPGDLILVAPEFDAVSEQFCLKNRLDASFWPMTESNYDVVSTLDLTQFSGVFDSFSAYQKTRSGMETKGYGESPFAYDDDGNRYTFPTYNAHGDFILPRPNSERDELHRHNIADYTLETVTPEAADALNREFLSFTEKGVTVLFTYAPRNRSSLTERSTVEEREKVHAMLKERLSVPVISGIEDSLYSGVYFWNIDNHLSTEGVQIRTGDVIRDLKKALYGIEPAPANKGGAWKIPYPAALCLYAAALLLAVLGAWRGFSWAGYAAGLVWTAASVAALLYGASASVILLCTLPLLLIFSFTGKRGEEA